MTISLPGKQFPFRLCWAHKQIYRSKKIQQTLKNHNNWYGFELHSTTFRLIHQILSSNNKILYDCLEFHRVAFCTNLECKLCQPLFFLSILLVNKKKIEWIESQKLKLYAFYAALSKQMYDCEGKWLFIDTMSFYLSKKNPLRSVKGGKKNLIWSLVPVIPFDFLTSIENHNGKENNNNNFSVKQTLQRKKNTMLYFHIEHRP